MMRIAPLLASFLYINFSQHATVWINQTRDAPTFIFVYDKFGVTPYNSRLNSPCLVLLLNSSKRNNKKKNNEDC